VPQIFLGNISLFVGVLLTTVVIAIRALARDAQLRHDLRSALTSYFGFLLFKTALLPFEGVSHEHALYKTVVVVWMLCFAFGVVRTVIALFLWAYRRFTGQHTTKIFRDVLMGVFYLAAAVPILKTQLAIDLTSLLATSAILSVVLGLALQDTLGNLFAGLSIQLERPFEVGDFIQVGQHVGKVQVTGWRSTRIETTKHEQITLTNNAIAKEAVKNYSRGGMPIGIDVYFGAAYSAPPNAVRREALAAMAEVPLILKNPAPSCRASAWEDNAVKYMVRCFISDYGDLPNLHDELFTRLWYRFSRAGIEIPFPQRVIHNKAPEPEPTATWVALLDRLDLFNPFSKPEREAIAAAANERHFGRGETIVTEGEEGNTFYVVTSGRVAVTTRSGGRIAQLTTGEYFGEMSLLTGAPRSATVTAVEDAQLLEFDRPEFADLFIAKPQLAETMSEVLAKRKAALEAATSNAPTMIGGDPEQSRILSRLRQIFALRS
jgi:small-conductance mechanosensitive channel/CRP-like cAMP-binding protein